MKAGAPFEIAPQPLRFLAAILLSVAASTAYAMAEGVANPYLAELVDSARQSKLANEREWHLLLHYRENLFGGVTSEQDDEGFFLSPRGSTIRRPNWKRHRAQLFSAEPVGRLKQPAQCAFIARYHWLKESSAI